MGVQEIKCPNCGKFFQVDESGYARILSQVRDREFEKELSRRKRDLEEKKESDLKLARSEQRREFEQTISEKEMELARKDSEIEKLRSKISGSEAEKKLAVNEAVNEKKAEISQLKEKLSGELAKKEVEITELKAQLSNKDTKIELEGKAVKEQYERDLKAKQEQYERDLRARDEEIKFYKDFKARQSTKMVGESLEMHCLNQFNSLRMTAFPAAYFEKDNDARTGSKGDFIFRESSDGVEFISIMFEMKNEMDETATKHKNEDFFKELDKDRREKKCEYAVLVSLLETDNELYNNGIVDVSYKYDKMYVIRPQFFIPMITLLRNAALNSLKYRRELEEAKNQQVDILHFEENMQSFKDGFSRNYRIASEKFNQAIDEIDKSISHLQKIKDALLSSENNLRLANNKADDLSIKKLTKNAPSVKKMFDELNE